MSTLLSHNVLLFSATLNMSAPQTEPCLSHLPSLLTPSQQADLGSLYSWRPNATLINLNKESAKRVRHR